MLCLGMVRLKLCFPKMKLMSLLALLAQTQMSQCMIERLCQGQSL